MNRYTYEQAQILAWLREQGFRVKRYDPATGELVLDLGTTSNGRRLTPRTPSPTW